jgi:universal stress protein A
MLRVLCPVDFSDTSRRALRYGAALAGRFDGQLTVLFAEDPLLASAAAAGYNRQALIDASTRALGQFVRQVLGQKRASSSRYVASFGTPENEIEKLARRLPADVIVMGTHGRGRATRLLFGSTTRGVLKRASVPVVIVPRSAAREPSKNWR